MSLWMETGLYVKVKQFNGSSAPRPLPLESGFSENMVYRVLGCHTASETAEAYFVLSNDRDEVWFISNRHFRTAFIDLEAHYLRADVSA